MASLISLHLPRKQIHKVTLSRHRVGRGDWPKTPLFCSSFLLQHRHAKTKCISQGSGLAECQNHTMELSATHVAILWVTPTLH